MKYNLRVGKSRYTSKTIAECVDIIAIKYNEVAANCITPAAWIISEVVTMPENVSRLAYHGNNQKVFISINKEVRK